MTPEQTRQERIAHFERLMRFGRASRCFAAPGSGVVGTQRLVAWEATG